MSRMRWKWEFFSNEREISCFSTQRGTRFIQMDEQIKSVQKWRNFSEPNDRFNLSCERGKFLEFALSSSSFDHEHDTNSTNSMSSSSFDHEHHTRKNSTTAERTNTRIKHCFCSQHRAIPHNYTARPPSFAHYPLARTRIHDWIRRLAPSPIARPVRNTIL